MYWVNGAAKVLEAKGVENDSLLDLPRTRRGALIAMKRNRLGTLFATLSPYSVYLWCSRPSVLLSKVKRSEDSVQVEGENVNLLWKPDSTVIAVITSKGVFHFYNVFDLGGKLFEFQFTSPHHYVKGSGFGSGIPKFQLKFRNSVAIANGVASCESVRDEIVVCTNEGQEILSFSWSGSSEHVVVDKVEDILLKMCTVIDIVYHKNSDLFGWLTSLGQAYVAKRCIHEQTTNENEPNLFLYNWMAFPLTLPDPNFTVTCISFSNRAAIALGTEGGVVYVFSISKGFELPVLRHVLYQEESSHKRYYRGSISCVEWTEDGYALAVGWKDGGFAVWSLFGHLLVNTSEEEEANSENEAEEEFYLGIRTMFWGIGSYELFILPSVIDAEQIYLLPVAKSSTINCPTESNSHFLLLHSDDQIFINQSLSGHYTPLPMDFAMWNTIQMPMLYITDNWPIKYVCICDSGKRLVAAGSRGLVYLTISTGKWKMFGNQLQEQSFICRGGLSWFRHVFIVACEMIETHSFHLLFFNADNKLDLDLMLLKLDLPRAALTINVSLHTLIVYTVDGFLRRYQLSFNEASQLTVQLKSEQSLDPWITTPNLVQKMIYFPLEMPDSTKSIIDNDLLEPLVVLTNGHLFMLRPSYNQNDENGSKSYEEIIVLGNMIEHIQSARCLAAGMWNSLWAFSKGRILGWMNICFEQRQPESNQLKWRLIIKDNIEGMGIPADFYPLTLSFTSGIMCGVEQILSKYRASETGFFKAKSMSAIFFQYIVRYLLSKRLHTTAIGFANHFENRPHFAHALELLLHKVLEMESETLTFGVAAVLPSVIKFLENYPYFLDVVVRCARKTEVALWDYLFSIAGPPQELFERCLELNLLRTATSYLIIIQTMEPFSVSKRDSLKLLEKVLEAEDFELCQELVRFLSSIFYGIEDGAEDIMDHPDDGNLYVNEALDQLSSNEMIKSCGSVNNFADDAFHINVLVIRHARKLLYNCRLKALVKLSSSLKFSLEKFLRKERFRSAMVEDFEKALNALYDQYKSHFEGMFKNEISDDVVPTTICGIQAGGNGGSAMVSPVIATPIPRRNTLDTPGSGASNTEKVRESDTKGIIIDLATQRGTPTGLSKRSSFTAGSRKKAIQGSPATASGEIHVLLGDDEELHHFSKMFKEAKCFRWASIIAYGNNDMEQLESLLTEAEPEETRVIVRKLYQVATKADDHSSEGRFNIHDIPPSMKEWLMIRNEELNIPGSSLTSPTEESK